MAKHLQVPGKCPICSMRFCDHTPDQRGQTLSEMFECKAGCPACMKENQK